MEHCVHDQSNANYDAGNEIICNKSNLYGFNDVYILVRDYVIIVNENELNKYSKIVCFLLCVLQNSMES